MGMQTKWECEDCGWPWPLPSEPTADAECDNCGGPLIEGAGLVGELEGDSPTGSVITSTPEEQ